MIPFSRSIFQPFGLSTFFSESKINYTPSFYVNHQEDSELIFELINEILEKEILSEPSEIEITIVYDKKDVENEKFPPLIEYLPIISIQNKMLEHFLSINHKIELNREIKKLLELEYLKSDKKTTENDLGLISIEVIDEKEYLFY